MERTAERPERRPEETFSRKSRSSSEGEFPRNQTYDEDEEDTHYMVTRDNDASNVAPEFSTRLIPSRTALSQSNCDHNDSLDTTLPAPEQSPLMAVQHPIHRLADVLTILLNRTAAQRPLTIRPVNTTTTTFDGNGEKFELFEDLFHIMIKMHPEMTEQTKINHSFSFSAN